jgi:hypothetical protein
MLYSTLQKACCLLNGIGQREVSGILLFEECMPNGGNVAGN